MKLCSTLVFKVLTWIFAITTKIYTKCCFTQAHVKSFMTICTPSYSSELCYLLWQLSIGTMLEHHPFPELVDLADRCVVTHCLARSDFHGHCCCLDQHLLWCPMNFNLGASAFGLSCILPLRTKNSPLRTLILCCTLIKQVGLLPI